MIRLKVLIGMEEEVINITKDEFQLLVDYGKLKTDEIITVKTESGNTITSIMIDAYKVA